MKTQVILTMLIMLTMAILMFILITMLACLKTKYDMITTVLLYQACGENSRFLTGAQKDWQLGLLTEIHKIADNRLLTRLWKFDNCGALAEGNTN